MKFFYYISFTLFLQISFVQASIENAGTKTARSDDYRQIKYPTFGETIKLENWRAISGDKPSYSKVETNDKNWKKVKVGQGIIQQGISGQWCWYRVKFDLPESWQDHPLILDIGRISAYGELYLNGIKCADSGTPPPRLKHGCSKVYWKYVLQPELLKKGENLLAVRVFIGYKKGLYDGAYTIQQLPYKAVCIRLPLKSRIKPSDSLKQLLTETAHLNHFQAGSEIILQPELLSLNKENTKGVLKLKLITPQGKIKATEVANLTLANAKWQSLIIRIKAPKQAGKYFCQLKYSVGSEVFINKKIELNIYSKSRKQSFSIPVNAKLSQKNELPIKITPGPLGRFSPKFASSQKAHLYDITERTDSRSGMAYSVQLKRRNGGPKLFLANVRPVPENLKKLERFHLAAGHKYDGVTDAWIYGYIRPNRAGKAQSLKIKDINWTGRTYHYTYANGNYMNFTVSAINPAWMVHSDCLKLRIFDRIKYHGIDVPQYLAYESKGKIKIVKASKGIRGSDMSANWVLAWFNGGKNWKEFDSPYLFVLEKRLKAIKTISSEALFFVSNDTVGRIQGMPLYGVTLLEPSRTGNWAKELPEKVIKRCRFWSKVLASPPSRIKRSVLVDYKKDRLLLRDEVKYLAWNDAWNTAGLKITPISTILPLAVNSGNLKISVDRPVSDLHMATLQGPLVAAKNTDVLTFAFDDLLHYLREVRVIEPGKSPLIKEVKNAFNKLLERGYKQDLQKQPWAKLFYNGYLLPGNFRIDYTNLLLSRVWMNPETLKKIDRSVKAVSEKYLLYTGIPDSAMLPYLQPRFKIIPAVTVLTNPVSSLKLAVGPISRITNGIDSVYFSNLNVYMAWLYSYTYQRPMWLKKHYELLKEYFNTARNSHDWSTLASWDTFGGIRVGNGLQESGGIYAGTLAMTRIARSLKDFETSDLAAYHALMQLVSMQGTLAASDYLKQYRPWPATHSQSSEIEYTQKIRKAYFAELNELAGLSQLLIGINNSASSPGGYIESPLPEIMRPYQDIWGKFTDDFYDPHIDAMINTDRRLGSRISIDAFVYQTKRSPDELKNIFEMRSKLKQKWWASIPDYRGYLDSLSTIKYHKLW